MVRNPELHKLLEEGDIPVKQRRSLSEETADTLRELILTEKVAPGTAIPERDLAELLGISRTPMREAMRLLEIEGLIEYTATRRPFVANPSFALITQYLAVIGSLEALGGQLACDHATDEQLAEISHLNTQMHQTSDTEDPLNFFKLDMQFHTLIVAAGANAPLIETHRQYNGRLFRARFVSSRMRLKRAQTLSQHQKITQALLSRDKQKTAFYLNEHLESAIDNIEKSYLAEQSGKNTDEKGDV